MERQAGPRSYMCQVVLSAGLSACCPGLIALSFTLISIPIRAMNCMVMESHGRVSERERNTLERSLWLQHGAQIGAAKDRAGR